MASCPNGCIHGEEQVILLQSQRGARRMIRLVALFEALKGIVVVLAATGVASLLHRDLHAIALSLVEHARLNPASRYPQIFLDLASDLQNGHLLLLALGAAAYAALRFIEAYGLYYERAWAELLAAGSGAVYIPFELLEFMRQRTVLSGGLLLANAAVVAIMLYALLHRRRTVAGDRLIASS